MGVAVELFRMFLNDLRDEDDEEFDEPERFNTGLTGFIVEYLSIRFNSLIR